MSRQDVGRPRTGRLKLWLLGFGIGPASGEDLSATFMIDARRVVAYHHRADKAVVNVQDRIVPFQGQVLNLGS